MLPIMVDSVIGNGSDCAIEVLVESACQALDALQCTSNELRKSHPQNVDEKLYPMQISLLLK